MPEVWPPKVGKAYPDLNLMDQTGQRRPLSRFKGRVILIEPVGMTCAGCQAFAGAHDVGAFRGQPVQKGLGSIEEYMQEFGNLDLDDDRIVYVQLILYGLNMKAPSLEDAQAWAKHFGMEEAQDRIVLVGDPSFIGPASRRMIPGFQLVDKNFILRADATKVGRDDLYGMLLPMVSELIDE